MRITIDQHSWRNGYADGYLENPYNDSAVDAYSYSSGYIEGAADRQQGNLKRF